MRERILVGRFTHHKSEKEENNKRGGEGVSPVGGFPHHELKNTKSGVEDNMSSSVVSLMVI